MIKGAVIFFFLLGTTLLTSNQAQADQIQSFFGCAKITDNDQRLACFDLAAKKAVGSDIAQNRPHEVKVTKEQKVANFGKTQLRESPIKKAREEQKKAEDKELKEIRLKVEKFVYTASKKFVLFMDNGQIWKQKSGGRIRLPKGEFEVKIKKGMLGGYNIIVPTKKTLIRVKRLK
ncbi:MAG: hypothetical protein COA81_07825 [Alphaproteobacteria bacterium]|nr:MAG: hypothetical protein COA81_07825 [Alphaproteobacteria bacterium]